MPTIYTHINANKRRSWFLMGLCIAVLFGIGYFLDQVYGNGTWGWTIVALIYATISTLIGYYKGDKIALWTSGAVPVTKEQNPYLVRMVENLAITTGLPVPHIYIIPDEDINAFATGRDPKHASIAVTQGAIDKLANEELEGVIAHEISHIGNYDIRYMTLVIVIVGTIIVLSDMFWRVRFGRSFGRSNDRSGAGAIMMLAGILLLILAPLFAELIKLAVSRKREYLADASGALLTRYPEGLARALEKIRDQGARIERATKSTAHLYIANPMGTGFSKFFSTHPPIDDRINRLRQMGNVNA